MDSLLPSRRAVLASAAGIAAAAALPAIAQAPDKREVKVSLGWTFIATQAPFPYGVDKGFFKAEGLDVAVDRGSGAGTSVQRVVSGAYDFGYADIGTIALYNAQNPGRQVLAVYIVEDDSPLTLITLAGSGITKPRDIEGKRIGVSQFDGARLMFPVFARANRIDTAGITWKTVDATMRETMLARGEVDVITGFTTTSMPLLASMNQKPVALRYPENGVAGFGQALIVTREFAGKSPDMVAAFVRALNRSVKAMVRHPREALESLKKRDGLVNMDMEAARMDLLLRQLVLTPAVQKNGLSSADPKRLADAVENVRTVANTQAPLPVDHVYTTRFLPPAADRMVAGTRP